MSEIAENTVDCSQRRGRKVGHGQAHLGKVSSQRVYVLRERGLHLKKCYLLVLEKGKEREKEAPSTVPSILTSLFDTQKGNNFKLPALMNWLDK